MSIRMITIFWILHVVLNGVCFASNSTNETNRITSNAIEVERVETIANSDIDGEHVTNLYSNSLNGMLSMVNESVNECEDFFQHACGNYEIYQENSMSVPPFLSNLEDRMHFFFEHKDEFVTAPGKQLSQLYDQCKQRQRVRNERYVRRQWRRMLREIDFFAPEEFLYRQFPLLQFQWENWVRAGGGKNASASYANGRRQVSWVPLAAQLAAHGMPTLLNVFFAEQTIYIAPPTEAVTVNGGWRCPSLSDTIISLQPMLGGRNAQIALIVGHELWELCVELSEDKSLQNENKTDTNANDNSNANTNTKSSTKRDADTYAETNTTEQSNAKANGHDEEEQQFLQHEDIVEYFDIFFSVMELSLAEVHAARKLLLNVEQLLNILHVVRTTQPRILFNYVLWRAYEQLKYDDCYELTIEFELPLQAEYWDWHVFQSKLSRDVTLALYLFHTARYRKLRQQKLNAARSWESVLLHRATETEKQRRRMLRRIREMETLIRQYGLQLSGLSITSVLVVEMKPNSFYSNLVKLRRHKLRQSFFAPSNDSDDPDDISHILNDFINFAISLIKRPLFHYFATSDFNLWHNSPLFVDAGDDFYAAWHCLSLNDEQLVSQSEALAVYRFGNAFRAVYDDYQFWLEAQTFAFAEDFFLNYFAMDPQRVLFYAVAQTYCGRNDALYGPLVNRSFKHLAEFQIAFNCSSDQKVLTMYSVTPCL